MHPDSGKTPEEQIYWDQTAEQRLHVEDDLNAVLAKLYGINEHPDFRSRRMSLAITNLEQAMHWLGMETRDR